MKTDLIKNKIMKKILLLALLTLIITSCCDETTLPKKEYSFKIFYNCKEKIDTFKWVGYGDNLFTLQEGDLRLCYQHKTLLSGISRFEVISIKKIDTIPTSNIPAEEKLFHNKK